MQAGNAEAAGGATNDLGVYVIAIPRIVLKEQGYLGTVVHSDHLVFFIPIFSLCVYNTILSMLFFC